MNTQNVVALVLSISAIAASLFSIYFSFKASKFYKRATKLMKGR